MTKLEAVRLIRLILPNYPNMEGKDFEAIAELWAKAMADVDYATAESAVVKVVRHCRFWPTVADICAPIDEQRTRLARPIPLTEVSADFVGAGPDAYQD